MAEQQQKKRRGITCRPVQTPPPTPFLISKRDRQSSCLRQGPAHEITLSEAARADSHWDLQENLFTHLFISELFCSTPPPPLQLKLHSPFTVSGGRSQALRVILYLKEPRNYIWHNST